MNYDLKTSTLLKIDPFITLIDFLSSSTSLIDFSKPHPNNTHQSTLFLPSYFFSHFIVIAAHFLVAAAF